MYKNILIAVSLDTDRDVAAAIDIAKVMAADNAKVTFLHVLYMPSSYVTPYLPDDIEATSREAAKKKVAQLVEQVPGSTSAIVMGSAGRQITDYAEHNNIDCIVIASHRPVVSDILLGSTAAWVVRHANCAVHVIR